MRAVRPDTRLVLVGDGPMAGELTRSGLGVVVAGRLVHGELSAHYASADIFLFPSTTETFGNVTMEAMASGLAVIAYDYAAARQHIVHGRSGLRPTTASVSSNTPRRATHRVPACLVGRRESLNRWLKSGGGP
jgi:glycosyltransferase involved in cell wall biosynthesis